MEYGLLIYVPLIKIRFTLVTPTLSRPVHLAATTVLYSSGFQNSWFFATKLFQICIFIVHALGNYKNFTATY